MSQPWLLINHLPFVDPMRLHWGTHHQRCDSDLWSLLPLVIGQFVPHVIHIPAANAAKPEKNPFVNALNVKQNNPIPSYEIKG